MNENFRRALESGGVEHPRPEKTVESDNVLADEVVKFDVGIVPHFEPAGVLETCDISDRGIDPDIKVFVFAAGNLKTEIRRVARNAPSAQWLLEPLEKFIRNVACRMVWNPFFEIVVLGFKFPVEMLRILDDWRRSAGRALRRAEFLRAVCRAALVAAVAVLIRSAALGADALHKAIGEKHPALFAVKLGSGLASDISFRFGGLVDLLAELLVFRRIRSIIVVEPDLEIRKIFKMLGMTARDKLFGGYPFFAGTDHNGSSVSIVGAYVNALVAAHFLKAYPKVGLDIFYKMTDMNVAVCVRQRARYNYLSLFAHINSLNIFLKLYQILIL